MKRLLKIFAIVLAGGTMLYSCSKDQVGEIYSPQTGDGLISFNAPTSGHFVFSPDNSVMIIDVFRSMAEGSATISISNTQESESETVNVLDIPSEVVFEDGSYTAKLKISYNENLKAETTYTITISLPEGMASPGGNESFVFNASMAYVWKDLGEGEFYDNIAGMIQKVNVLVATNTNIPDSRYRIMNPYPAEVSKIIAANVGGAVGGPTSEYIEFVVDHTTQMLSWDGYWNCGVLVDGSLSFSSMNYFYGTESPFSGGAALVDECGIIGDGVFQFAPHVSAFANEDQSSGWTYRNTYEFLALPGIDLAEFLGI